jgi:hypothetical protein
MRRITALPPGRSDKAGPAWPLAFMSEGRQAFPGPFLQLPEHPWPRRKKSSVRRGTGQSSSSLELQPSVPAGQPSWDLFQTFALPLAGEELGCSVAQTRC